MSKKGYYKLLIVAVAVLLAAGLFAVTGKNGIYARSAVAPGFSIKTFDGGEWSLEEQLGSPVVINFWASWCGPCRMEAGVLRRAHQQFAPAGVKFVGIAVQDKEEDSREFISQYDLTFPMGPDPTEEIMKSYEVYGIPKTFVLDRSGRISYVHTGAIPESVLIREINKVL